MKSKIVKSILLNIQICIFIISCNDSGNKILSPGHQPLVTIDSSIYYADDIMDDTLLNFLDILPRDTTAANSYDILLDKDITVGQYSEFRELYSSNPSIFENKKVLKIAVDSINHRKGIVAGPKLSLISLNKARLHFFSLNSAEIKWADLLTKITDTALYLTTKEHFRVEAEDNNAPTQKGLAYSWGRKDYSKRMVPTKKDTIILNNGVKRANDTCNYRIFGLDCSGFISVLFNKNGVSMVQGKADQQRQVEYLTKILSTYFGNDSFLVKDMKHLPTEEFKTGDIVYYYSKSKKAATHIGIILEDRTGKLFFCESHGKPSWCDRNLLIGPSRSDINARLIDSNFRTVRITPHKTD